MNMHGARDLVVDSVTGVDLALPVAGAGARCYAFIVDWLIRTILFSAWYGVAALIYNGRWSLAAPLNPDARWFIFVVAPAAGTYFLYHIALEIALHGRTPGKRIAGIHIVARDGSSPSIGALLIRNVFRLVDSLPLFYGVGLVVTLVTKDHVRIGDMAAGTLLAYERADLVLPERPPTQAPDRPLTAADVEIAHDLLLRWPSLESTARRRLAIAIISKYASAAINVSPEDSEPALRAQLEKLTRGRTG
jgi:uncharacterized RDD family membrane protein YckC